MKDNFQIIISNNYSLNRLNKISFKYKNMKLKIVNNLYIILSNNNFLLMCFIKSAVISLNMLSIYVNTRKYFKLIICVLGCSRT